MTNKSWRRNKGLQAAQQLQADAKIYCKIKLQLKFIKNKNYTYINWNFHQAYTKTYINLHLKLRKNKNYKEKRTSHFSAANSTCAPPQWHHCVQASSTFRSNARTILIFLLQIIWIVHFTRPNSRQTSAVYFSIFDFSYHLKFSFDAQNLPFFRHCSHTNRCSRTVQGICTQ